MVADSFLLNVLVSTTSFQQRPPPPSNRVHTQDSFIAPGTLAQAPAALEDSVRAWSRAGERIAFRYALLDLNADGVRDAVAVIDDRRWCGSGGCSFLVLAGRPDGTFRLVSASTVTREPILLLPDRAHGWHTLAVSVGGGGKAPCQVLMRFDGAGYPRNPTLIACASPTDLARAKAITLK